MSVLLNLRISGDKRKPLTKKTIVKEEDVCWIIENLCNKAEYIIFKDYFKELKTTTNVDKQLAILKEIKGKYVKNIEEETNKDLVSFCISLLVEIYLSVPLKSPLKSGIARMFNNLSKCEQEILQKELCESILNRLCQKNLDLQTYNDLSNTLLLCFESFPQGSASILACETDVLICINYTMELCIKLLLTELSPTYKLEVCQCVHNAVRVAVCILQKTLSNKHEDLKSHAFFLLSLEDLPLDTRNNCGFLYALCSKVEWMQLLTQFHNIPDDITKLCLITGILNTVPCAKLEQPLIYKKEKLEIPAINFIFNNIMDIQNRNFTDCIITLSVSRTILIFIRTIQENSIKLLPLLPRLLEYTWINLDHHMDSVKHLALSVLESLVKLNGPGVDVLHLIHERMVETPMWCRAKHAAINVLISKIPVGDIIAQSPDIIFNLLEHLQNQVVASNIVKSYEGLMQQHYEEELDKDLWSRLWVQPLLLALDHSSNVALQQVLTKAVRIRPHIVQDIINSENCNINTTLSCLLVSHKLGLLDIQDKEDSKWKGLISYQTLSNALLHPKDKVRLSCLALLVESHKTTEVFSIAELLLIKQYLIRNLSYKSPASKQQSQSLINKFLVRLKNSSPALKRDIQSLEKKEANTGYLVKAAEEYLALCEWLVKFCVDNLFPGANYCRRNTALQILTLCNQLELWPDSRKTEQEGKVLLACLGDSYEDNKSLAMNLLVDMSEIVPAFQDPAEVVSILKECLSLGSSIRPSDSTTAAYLLSTLGARPLPSDVLHNICAEFGVCTHIVDIGIAHAGLFCFLSIILKNLAEQLEVAQTCLLRAAASGPLYGLLLIVRHLLQHISFKDLDGDKFWKDLIKQIIDMSFSCSQVVASVVNSSSPEGHLPMDFDFDLSLHQKNLKEEVEDTDPIEVSSQMVLLCSWRTVKEVSLLLGYIAEQATVSNENKDCVLQKKYLFKIGDHLIAMLAETKHRGAFEQAYVGFCKLAHCLWRSSSSDLHGLPNTWLEETMQEISNGGKLCATRRSAGIPFMIQALICTELEVKSQSTLNVWMIKLLDMAENELLSAETHTHSLNIMRALFRNTQLGETVNPFVERAIIITVNGFSASTWPERNSSTLLLSTLISRIFGVLRSKSHKLSWKNKMTGRIFFHRYPKLFNFFLNHLEKASKSNETGLNPSLYPVLLILGRLYPSSLEGTDSTLQLSEFIPYIQACASSSVLKTRTLAAAAMVPLIPPDRLTEHLQTLFSKLKQSGQKTNAKHGILLQIASHLENATMSLTPCGSYIPAMHQECNQLLKMLENEKCPVISESILTVLILLSSNISNNWNEIKSTIINLLFVRSSYNTSPIYFKKLVKLLLKLSASHDCNDEVIDNFSLLFKHENYDVIQETLQFLHYVLTSVGFSELQNKILESSSIAESILNMMCCKNIHTSDMDSLLKVVKVFPLLTNVIVKTIGVQGLAKFICIEDEGRVIDVLECFSKLLCENVNCSEEDILCINKLLVKYTGIDCSEECHVTVANLLLKHFKALSSNSLLMETRLVAYSAMVQLECDDLTTWQSLIKDLVENEMDFFCKAVVLLALALGDLSTNDNVQKARVFDKAEVSSLYEEAMLSQLAGEQFRNLLLNTTDGQLLLPLSPLLFRFLQHHCGIITDSLVNVLDKLKQYEYEQDVEGVCDFLKPGYETTRLKAIKVMNVLQHMNSRSVYS